MRVACATTGNFAGDFASIWCRPPTSHQALPSLTFTQRPETEMTPRTPRDTLNFFPDKHQGRGAAVPGGETAGFTGWGSRPRKRSAYAGGRAAGHSLRGVKKTYFVFEGVLAAPWGGVRQLAAASTPLGGSNCGRVVAPVLGGQAALTPIFNSPLGEHFLDVVHAIHSIVTENYRCTTGEQYRGQF